MNIAEYYCISDFRVSTSDLAAIWSAANRCELWHAPGIFGCERGGKGEKAGKNGVFRNIALTFARGESKLPT